MSQKKITQIQRYLAIIVLFLLCVVLFLLILGRSPSQEPVKIKPLPPVSTQSKFSPSFENQSSVFKEIKDLNETKEENLSEENKTSDLNLSLEQNLSPIKTEENASLKIEKSFEQNSSIEQNLSLMGIINEKNTTKANISTTKPKLAIIIDDMVSKEQVVAIKKLKLKLNPSFFPPYKNHTHTPKLATEFEFYMVHLPLEALNFTHKMPFLSPKDSEAKIEKTIQDIKENFKNLKYINNHTGSLFTSDAEAMRKLFEALEKHQLKFVDSRTAPHSKVPQIAKEFQKIYIKRDIFLDNEENVNYTKNQIKKVVELAQKKGFAIAIGHPKKTTLKALEESKDLLKSVELVYLSEIYGK